MGNRPLCKIVRIHLLGTLGSEGLKVTALNLFHPTASPPFPNVSFYIVTQPPRERGDTENFHGSSLPAEALTQAGAPSGHGVLAGILVEKGNRDGWGNDQNTGKPFEKVSSGLPVSDVADGRLINLHPLLQSFQAWTLWVFLWAFLLAFPGASSAYRMFAESR